MSDYTQNGGGLLSGVEPGKRVKDAINRVRGSGSGSGNMPDMSQAKEVIPDNPGPALAGRNPIIGNVRRERDMPVLRDELSDRLK